MPAPPNHIDVLLQAANGDLADDTPWQTFEFMLEMAETDATTINEADSMNLFRNLRRAIVEERKDGMRDASREHVAAVLAVAKRKNPPGDITSAWSSLKFCLTMSNKSLAVPDSADWLRSFNRFRCIIAGEEAEQDITQHAPPSGAERAQSDSAYDSQFSECDPKDEGFVTVLLDRGEKRSLPYMISDEHERHLMLKTASRRCELYPDRDELVRARCLPKDSLEPSTIQFEVVEDDLEDADIVFSRKLLVAEKKRNVTRERRRGRDQSRSAAGSSAGYFEEEDHMQATSYAIGIALQSPSVRNLDDKGIENLGIKVDLAIRAARSGRGR